MPDAAHGLVLTKVPDMYLVHWDTLSHSTLDSGDEGIARFGREEARRDDDAVGAVGGELALLVHEGGQLSSVVGLVRLDLDADLDARAVDVHVVIVQLGLAESLQRGAMRKAGPER